MSNLNINNIDVQRIINVLNELNSKIELCSLLTFRTIENINNNRDKLEEQIDNPQFFSDLDEHFLKMGKFKITHIEILEELKETDKNNSRNDEKIDDDEESQGKVAEIAKTERTDLIGITEETSDVTKDLAKSTRNFCRRYYKEISILKEMNAIVIDPEIKSFVTRFGNFLLAHYIKKCQMTIEEEVSDKSLNASLTAKIIDLERQIKSKTEKYEKLKKDRQEFKQESNNKINEIANEISQLRENTKNNLDEMTKKVNLDLNTKSELTDRAIEELNKKLKQATEEFDKKKEEDKAEEDKNYADYNKNIAALQDVIVGYDATLKGLKETNEDLKVKDAKVKQDLNERKKLLETTEEKYLQLRNNFLNQQEKMKNLKYESEVKIRSCEWIQAQFRGFWVRKVQRKKFKFLNALRLPKIVIPEPKPTKRNQRK